MVYKNGDKYEGDWAYDLRHGLGTLWIYKGGKYVVRYNGEWRDDQPTGHGTFFDDSGDTYEGEWLNGQRHGKGRAVYGGRPVDGFGGDIYEGSFENDMKCVPQCANQLLPPRMSPHSRYLQKEQSMHETLIICNLCFQAWMWVYDVRKR